ncbi:MAG: hypothetical protein ACTSUE_08200 [Promethearchaeota archaeon]
MITRIRRHGIIEWAMEDKHGSLAGFIRGAVIYRYEMVARTANVRFKAIGMATDDGNGGNG